METFELSERARIRVEYDQDARSINPREDWDQATGFVHIDGLGDSRLVTPPAVHEPEIRISDAFTHLRFRRGVPRHTDVLWRQRQEAIEATVRWARIFHGTVLEWDDEYGGFWFVAGAIANSPETQAAVIESERKVYRDWATGEVYTVALEIAEKWVKVERGGEPVDDPAERVDWSEESSMGGIYANAEWRLPEDVAAYYALTYAEDLTDDELAAARKLACNFREGTD